MTKNPTTLPFPVNIFVNQLISGNRGYKTNKAFFGAGPWRLLGVFI